MSHWRTAVVAVTEGEEVMEADTAVDIAEDTAAVIAAATATAAEAGAVIPAAATTAVVRIMGAPAATFIVAPARRTR
jgi:hypothetical protein